MKSASFRGISFRERAWYDRRIIFEKKRCRAKEAETESEEETVENIMVFPALQPINFGERAQPEKEEGKHAEKE